MMQGIMQRRQIGELQVRLRRVVRTAVVAVAITSVTITVGSQAASAAVVQTLAASVTGSGSVTVTWDQPTGANANDYSYTLYFRAGSVGGYTTRQIAAGTESTVLSGLTGGQSHEIRVTATPTSGSDAGREGCNIGGGACTAFLSSASTSVTAATTPTAPTITSVTAGNGQISVDFSPGATNGSEVSQYTASCGGVNATGTSSPVVVSALTNGIARSCTVTTGSNVGDSSASAASESVTPSTTPDAMDAPTVSGGNTSVSLTWTAVSATASIGGADPSVVDDGGSVITGYTVRLVLASDSSEVTTASALAGATTATVSGLTNGTAYKAQIRAANANGVGTYSSASAEFTPSAVVGTPSLAMQTQPGAALTGVALSGGARPVVNVGTAGVQVAAEVVSGASVSGTTAVTSDGSGLATFSNLIVTRGSTGAVQLRFTATGYNSVTSSAFTVTVSGGGTPGGGSVTTTTTTLPRAGSTPTTVPRARTTTTTIPRAGSATTVPQTATITVPRRLGIEVASLPQPTSRVAADATVALRARTLTVLVAPPVTTRIQTVTRYVITLRPVGGGRSVTRAVSVKRSKLVSQSFTNLKGGYRISVSAINKRGKVVGTWRTPRINVK
jgi:hypothetical protein